MTQPTQKIFAEHAWLAPGRFARRVLVEFDAHITAVHELSPDEHPPADALRAQWLTPGFVNAHCHLEYTWLENAGLPRGAVPFGEWMQAIISRRPTDPAHEGQRTQAMHQGARRLLQGGCTTVIDSTTDGTSAPILQQAGLRHFLFHEVLGLSQTRAQPIWQAATSWQQNAKRCQDNQTRWQRRPAAEPGDQIRWQRRPAAEPGDATKANDATGTDNAQPLTTATSPPNLLIGTGLNPHAPYSVGPWLRHQLNTPDAAKTHQAWHLAETPDEEQLFTSASGSIAQFLRTANMPMPWTASPGPAASPAATTEHPSWQSSFDYLRQMKHLDHCDLIFHGNHLAPAEAAFFAPGRGIVHCPATHRWFHRPPVPLKHWLNSGVNVCLGTDSLASADTLSMLDIIRITLEDHPDLTANDALTMACTNPWRLRFMQTTPASKPAPNGTITIGAIADLAAWDATPPAPSEPEQTWTHILKTTNPSRLKTWIGGQVSGETPLPH